jgi:peptidoglycan hydrolase-like protein with peptidoglycan-binding domain
MSIAMYDSVDISQIPASPQAAAGYVDGRFANVAELRDRFPGAHILTIAVTADADADCLDIETGDATPAQAAGWYARQQARGVARPCLYASASVMQADVVPLVQAAGILRGAVRLWSAHYTMAAHICGPGTCRAMSISADGTQWTDRAMGRNLDESLLADGFFGTAPAPDWQEALMNRLPVLKQGDTDKAGQVFYVHRAQALIRVYGEINGITAAACIGVTGTFDGPTAVAVKAIQASKKLAVDGVVGPMTWGVLVTGSAT